MSKLRTGLMFAVLAAALSLLLTASTARAQGVIKTPGEHPVYKAELEPHLIFADDHQFAAGFGVGFRASFPIMDPGFVKSINDNVAIGVGADLFHFGGCYYGASVCGANGFQIPVALQWNFFVAPRVSVFGEPGLALRYRTFDNCPAGDKNCSNPSSLQVVPFVLYGGARYHFNEQLALTGRVGFDWYAFGYFSIGLSIFV